ncbi:STM3941 family protein [Bradyrhizobium guangdongense]
MHARPDGVPIGGSRQSVVPSVCTDTSRDFEIGRCATRLRLLVAAGFAMTLLSASLVFKSTLVFEWWDDIGSYDTTMGYLGVALFGPITGWLIWKLPAERGPVVIITPYGIRDLRIGNEFLPWDSIADVSADECRGQKAIVLTPTPALQRQLAGIRSAARGTRHDRIVIRSGSLATDFDTLLRACRDCHAASTQAAAGTRATALQQEDEGGTQGVALQAS